MTFTKKFENFHDRNYKLFFILPMILMISSLVYIVYFYSQTGDFMHKDISLTGGTSVTINQKTDINELRNYLSGELEEFNLREISDLFTKEQKAVIIETTSDSEKTKEILERYLGYELTQENSSFEFTGSLLSQNFYRQLMVAILFAFLFMSIVVFFLFRTFIPSLAVIISAIIS